MAKTFEDALSVLETQEGGNELVEAVKSRLGKVNNEASNLRQSRNSIESKLKKLFELTGIDETVEDLESEFKNKFKASQAQNGSEIQKLTKQVEELIKQRDDATSKARKTELTNMINSALDNSKVLPSAKKPLINLILANTKYSDDGKVFFINGENEVDLNEGITGFIKENPHYVSIDQKAGSGGQGGQGGGNKQMKRDQFLQLSPQEQKDFTVTNKGVVVD